MGKALRELGRVMVSTGLAAGITHIQGNPANWTAMITLIPVIRFTSKLLHTKYPGKLWDWLPF